MRAAAVVPAVLAPTETELWSWRQLSLRGAEANQQGRNYGPMDHPARQLNNPAVASVYEREESWRLLAKAMFR